MAADTSPKPPEVEHPDCKACGKPTTPHCNGKYCDWVTCADGTCKITWNARGNGVRL